MTAPPRSRSSSLPATRRAGAWPTCCGCAGGGPSGWCPCPPRRVRRGRAPRAVTPAPAPVGVVGRRRLLRPAADPLAERCPRRRRPGPLRPPCADRPRRCALPPGRAPTGRTRARTRASTRMRPKSPVLGSVTTITSASPTATPAGPERARLPPRWSSRHFYPLHALSSLSRPLRAGPRMRLRRRASSVRRSRALPFVGRFPAAGFLPLARWSRPLAPRAASWPAATVLLAAAVPSVAVDFFLAALGGGFSFSFAFSFARRADLAFRRDRRDHAGPEHHLLRRDPHGRRNHHVNGCSGGHSKVNDTENNWEKLLHGLHLWIRSSRLRIAAIHLLHLVVLQEHRSPQ